MPFILALLVLCFPWIAHAQEDGLQPDKLSAQVRAENAAELVSKDYVITLWGIEQAGEKGSLVAFRGRTALDDVLGEGWVRCDVIEWVDQNPVARCMNDNIIDVAEYMLLSGYATVVRQDVIGSIYEEPYMTAERAARLQKKGIWQTGEETRQSISTLSDRASLSYIIGSVGVMGATIMIILSMLIITGFRKTQRLVKKSMALTKAQEEKIRAREKIVMATMLIGEIENNRGKIEAFVSINKDFLNSLKHAKENSAPHKFQSNPEIVQEQPALVRSVFDGNTDKLDLLGAQLLKDIVALYARIAVDAKYLTLDNTMSITQAITHMSDIVSEAESLLIPMKNIRNALDIILRDRGQKMIS